MRAKEFITEAVLDPTGWGKTAMGTDIDYFGLRVQMRPSVFLQLSHPLDSADQNPDMEKYMQSGGKIAFPFLEIKEPFEWEDGDFSQLAKVVGHEGRNRMTHWIKLKGDAPIQVNLFLRNANRRKYITDEIIQALSVGLVSQTGQVVQNPFDANTALEETAGLLETSNDRDLNEISMRPTDLRQQSSGINAVVGIEFEMAVPDVAMSDDDLAGEPDMSTDVRVSDFDSIAEFFEDSDLNSSRSVLRMVDNLQHDYETWATDRQHAQWQDEGRRFFDDYAVDWFDEDTAVEEAESDIHADYKDNLDQLTPDDLAQLVNELVKEKRQEWLDNEWDDEGRLYDRARDEWLSNQDFPSEYDYFRQNYPYMSDLPYDTYGVVWPHLTTGGTRTIKDIAAEFSEYIGMHVEWSERYHGAKRLPDAYALEPDSSIKPNSGARGLEFISPPLALPLALTNLKRVVKWAKSNGCYTNWSTGLHMNVSVPGSKPSSNIDYVKLVLLLGDSYVLEQFGRAASTYAVNSLNAIRRMVRLNPQQVPEILEQMKTGLNHYASTLIHPRDTDKYASVNVQDGYIEFRHPGGDWLNEDGKKLENTLLRFVVALDAACDETKYREEYLKKLYKVLSSPGQSRRDAQAQNQDTIRYFADYVAGSIPRSALVSFIRNAQRNRQAAATTVATTPQAQSTAGRWGRWNILDMNGDIIGTVSGRDEPSARSEALQLYARSGLSAPQFTVAPHDS